MYFFNEHPCQAEARNAARHALTLILLYEHILRMTNEAEKLPAALPQLKCLQENGPIITEKDPPLCRTQRLGKESLYTGMGF